jgi:hypothetical protein
MKAILAQTVLKFTAGFGDILEQNYSIFSGCPDPVQFALPIRGMFDQPRHGALSERLPDKDLHLVTACQQSHVQGAEVTGIAYA